LTFALSIGLAKKDNFPGDGLGQIASLATDWHRLDLAFENLRHYQKLAW
jgi:hypothetical protein